MPIRKTYTSTERHIRISAEVLADRFGICIERAKETLRATVYIGTRFAILPIRRRYQADRQRKVKRLNGKFATDTIWAKSLSLKGNVVSQIYINKCDLNAYYTISRAYNKQVGYSLNDFRSAYGAPKHLTYDGTAVQV